MHDITLIHTAKYRFLPAFKDTGEKQELRFKVAANWNELTEEQLLEIIRIQFSYEPSPYQKLLLLKELLQVKWALVHQFTSVQKLELFSLLHFLEENTLTRQLLPKISVRKSWLLPNVELYGPLDRFKNLTFSEFIFTDTLFSHYCKRNKEAILDKLIAVLYRPKRKNYDPAAANFKGDIRQDFNEHLIEQRVELVSKLPLEYKLAILTWYRGCRNHLQETYDLVFTESNQKKAAEGDWQDVLLHISGGKFGPMEQTQHQRLHLVFKEMQRLAREAKEMERIRENQK